MSQPLSDPLQAGLRFLPRPLPAAPSAHLTAGLPSRGDDGLTTLHRRNPRGLGPALTPVALIWGPPGTGKTKTLAAILAGACLEAARGPRPIRILVSAFTYTAIDNVLERFSEWAAESPIVGSINVVRLRAQSANANPTLPGLCTDVVTEPEDGAFKSLKRRLSSP